MAGEKFSDSRIKNSEYVYQALQNIYTKENGNYATQLAEDLGRGGREEATRLITSLENKNIVKKGTRTNAQYYVIDYSGLTTLFFSAWSDLDLSDEALSSALQKNLDIEKREFQQNLLKLLTHYCRAYFEDVKVSTLKKMFVEDFIRGLGVLNRYEELNQFEKQLYENLQNFRFEEKPDLYIEE